jgi:inosose dehydratase
MQDTTVCTNLYVYVQTLGREDRKIEICLDPVLEEVKIAGYPSFEGTLEWFDSSEHTVRIQKLLDRYQMKMPSAYTGGALYDPVTAAPTVERIVERAVRAHSVGAEAVMMNPAVLRDRPKTDEELRTQSDWLNRLGEKLRYLGMGLWIHNHHIEMQDDGRELKANLDDTDPDLVSFCADVHWIWRGGGDPYAYLERYLGRTHCMHLRNSKDKIWSEELGDGDLDMRRINRILRDGGFQGPLSVELALEEGTPSTRPLGESMRISREYLREVFEV